MNILQKIFTDHYEEIKYTLHPRDTEIENIDKMIHCGDPSFGGAMYHCPHCGNFKYVPFHCHSRFCPSCGNKYSMERTTSMTFKLINVIHRHCVFTIDENLRDFFLNDRSLLDCLFHSVASVISRMFFKVNRSKNFTPGFIMILHTFGRDLKWNPHIHCLISEGGLSDDGFWRNIRYFNYSFLRSASVPLSLMRYSNDWVILLSRSKLSAILLIRRDFMFMPNLLPVILKLPSNTSDVILGVL